MRMWGIDPKLLCNKHLLGEHVEMHMFAGTIEKNKSIQGYINKGLVNPCRIKERHDELSEEMLRRGMNHQSPLDMPFCSSLPYHPVSILNNTVELYRRCPDCRDKQLNKGG